MAYKIIQREQTYEARKGLEGPFRYANGRVLYYDPKEGQYWDPRTDIYLTDDEVYDLQGMVFEKLAGKM